MPGKWNVSMQYIDGRAEYIVYRLKNVNAVDHSGNREYFGNYTTDEAAAKAVAKKLNEED